MKVRVAKVGWACGWGIVLAACGHSAAPDPEGVYKGVMDSKPSIAGFSWSSVHEIGLAIQHGRARLYPDTPMSRPMEFKVKVDGRRIFLYENIPADGIIMTMNESGDALSCSSCEVISLPTVWERVCSDDRSCVAAADHGGR